MLNEYANVKAQGFLKIYEEETGKILLDGKNSIHPENFSLALAESLSNNNGFIEKMCFGNAGVRLSASNQFIYSSPQTIGRTASLYNETYSKVVNQNSSENVNKARNNMTVSHVTGNVYTDIMIKCCLEKNEPESQNILNNDNQIISEYSFNEVGLRNYKDDLITHICFAPIQKSSNITLIFNYLIRIQMI